MGVSFGATRSLAFRHASGTAAEFEFPQRDGDAGRRARERRDRLSRSLSSPSERSAGPPKR